MFWSLFQEKDEFEKIRIGNIQSPIRKKKPTPINHLASLENRGDLSSIIKDLYRDFMEKIRFDYEKRNAIFSTALFHSFGRMRIDI